MAMLLSLTRERVALRIFVLFTLYRFTVLPVLRVTSLRLGPET